jgi:peptide/nickel transport system ATP-binding protein
MTKYLFQVHDLNVWFSARKGFTLFRLHHSQKFIKAVDGLSFDIYEGETLAIVGESGSGKTTVARALMGLLREARGEIRFEDRNILAESRTGRIDFRTKMQIIFQNPFDAMNPRETIFKIVSEPLSIHRKNLTTHERHEIVSRSLRDVGLTPPEDFKNRFPHELSGGQRQRVLIAGALVLEPVFIIADEPVSMLDASLKVEILNLLTDLSKKRSLTYLIVSHDLALTRYIADRIAIMYLGKILEMGPALSVLDQPLHPYSQALIKVVPTLESAWKKKTILTGEIPHPSDIPKGCRFHPRCPQSTGLCRVQEPETKEIEPNRFVHCHYVPFTVEQTRT